MVSLNWPGFRIANLIIQSTYLVFHFLFILSLYRRRQPTPVWNWFFYLSVSLWIWVSGRFMETIVYLFFPDNNDAYVFAANYQYIGNTIAAVEYLIWVLYLSGHDRLASSRWFRIFLFLCPALTCTLVFTNDLHHLFYTKLVMGERVGHGILFTPCLIWMYLILLSGYAVSVKYVLRSGKDCGKQIFMFSLFPMLPAVGVLIRSISGVDRLDYTPMYMAVAIICLYQMIFRYHYVNIVPASILEALEQTAHPIGIYNPRKNELLYSNQAAKGYSDAAEGFLPLLSDSRTRLEGDFDEKHLLIDITPLPNEEPILVTVTDVSDVMRQQADLNAKIKNLEELQLELEEAKQNIDAYLCSLQSMRGIGKKQDLIRDTYAMITQTFKMVRKNLVEAGQRPEVGETVLQENLRLTRECITAIRKAVAELKVD